MEKYDKKIEIQSILITLLSGIISALGIWVFVYPSDFAPSGLDGLATILYELTNINIGFFIFILNFPLLVAAWFVLKRRYVLYTIGYTIITTVILAVFENTKIVPQYETSERIIPAIFAGVAQGFTGLMLKIGGSAGGVDIAASLVHKKFPGVNIEKLITIFSLITAGISYFVYWNLTSLLLSAIEIYICEKVISIVLKDKRNAVKFEIITDDPDPIINEIMSELKQGVTVLEGLGNSANHKNIIICLVNYRQISDFLKLLKKYKNTFVFYSHIMGVRGNFYWKNEKTDKNKNGERSFENNKYTGR